MLEPPWSEVCVEAGDAAAARLDGVRLVAIDGVRGLDPDRTSLAGRNEDLSIQNHSENCRFHSIIKMHAIHTPKRTWSADNVTC